MPPAYAKPYVKRNKNHVTDAEAICEAVTRPNMRFVAIKSAEQQSILVLHRARALLVRQRTMLANAIRAHLAEFGIVVAQGVSKLLEAVTPSARTIEAQGPLPPLVATALSPLIASLVDLGARIKTLENEIARQHRACESAGGPRFGVMTATAMAATVADPSVPVRRVRRLSGTDATAKLLQRQAMARRHNKNGQRISTHASRMRRDGCHPVRPRGRFSQDRLDQEATRKEACKGRCCGLGQQDGEDRLGDHGQAGRLPLHPR
jgi:transposase